MEDEEDEVVSGLFVGGKWLLAVEGASGRLAFPSSMEMK